MARELILIPKLKYERLLKNSPRESMQTEEIMKAKDAGKHGNKNINEEKYVKKTKTDDSYVKMKPKQFLKLKKKDVSKGGANPTTRIRCH